MYEIVKISFTYERGTTDGRSKVLLKKYDKEYKTEAAAKAILTKKGWEAENQLNDLGEGPNGKPYYNSVRWEVRKVK